MGGYAVSDFRRVDTRIGNNDDLHAQQITHEARNIAHHGCGA